MEKRCKFRNVSTMDRIRYLFGDYLEILVEEDEEDDSFEVSISFKPDNKVSFKKMVKEELDI